MVGEILKIKTNIPPLGPNILTRPQIQERLESGLTAREGFSRQLTLVSAPAGFGKTALVRKWLAECEQRAVWYSLDESDNEPGRFWIYLISALRTVQGNFGKGPLAMLRSGGLFSESSSTSESLLTTLLNELFQLKECLFLVIDDYHLINNPRIHKDMIFFIENMPPTVHLISTTRSDPPWPLHKWRAHGKMVEVRMDELTFTLEETRRLFTELNIAGLDDSQINALYKKTEGWVTGLQLAAYSLTTSPDPDDFIKSFTGSSRHVLHFLIEEVFSRQPETVQNFLLETSIMKCFNASLCNRVTCREDSTDVLALLERNNLFVIPLDEQGIWYRYHHLFADLLYHQLIRNYPEKVIGLHERASSWFLEEGEPGEAIRHALAGRKPERVARILEEYHEELLQNEDPALRSKSLDSIPLELLKKYPRLIAHKALFHLVQEGKEEARILLNLAKELSFEDDTGQKEFAGLLAAVSAYYHIYSHQFPQAQENAEKALMLLPPQENYWRMSTAVFSGDTRLFSGSPKDAYPFYLEAHQNNQAHGNHYLSLSTGTKLAVTLYYLGKLRDSEKLTRDMLQLARNEGITRVPRVGALWTVLGELLREKGELEEAEHCVERGLFISKFEKPTWGWNLLYKAALNFSRQKYHDVLSAVSQIETLHHEAELPGFVTFPAAMWKARALLEMGEGTQAAGILSKQGILKENEVQSGLEKGCLVLCRLLMTEDKVKDLPRARHLLDYIEKLADRGGHRNLLLEMLLVKTALEEISGNLEAADLLLEKALAQGKESGHFQIFVDEGSELTPVYTRITNRLREECDSLNRKEMLDYTLEILQNISPEKDLPGETHKVSAKTFRATEGPTQGLVEELTPRELEILQLISKGLTNQDISEKLFLSLGTIKWYNSNIYGKLGVKSRTQAAARAQKLKLIL